MYVIINEVNFVLIESISIKEAGIQTIDFILDLLYTIWLFNNQRLASMSLLSILMDCI